MIKKNLLYLFLLTVFCISDSFAQTIVTIPTANTAGAGANATIRRKPLGSNRSYERTAIRYSKNEIGLLGNISGIAFYCDTVLSPGKTAVKIYIKEVADTTFSAATTVATEESNAQIVFADTLFASSFIKNTWVPIVFSSPFLHANQSAIEIIIETNSGGLNGTDLTQLAKGFRYSSKGGTINSTQYWQSNANSSTIPVGNGTLTNNRPNIQLTITSAPACVAPPNAGTVISTSNSICANTNFTLSLNGTSTGLGLSYQWFSSINNIAFDTIVGANQPSLIANQSISKYYTCVVTCNGQKDTATVLNISMNPFYLCYCSTGLGGNCTGGQGTAIDSVSFTGTTLIKGNSGCSVNSYVSYPASGNTTANLTQGETYVLSNKFLGNVKASVWIDYNGNGVFENSEWKQICITSATGSVISNNINIPINATTGFIGMRIRSRAFTAQNDSTSACANFGNSGETEDYIVNIIAASACTSPPTAGVLNATDTLTCSGSVVAFSITGNSNGSGQTYEWLSSTDGINYTTVVGANDKFYSATINTNTFYKCKITCNAFSSFTNAKHIVLKPYYNCYCITGIGGNCAQQATAIDSIAIEGTSFLNAGTGCSPTYYTAYPDSGNTTAVLLQGTSYVMKTKFNGAVRASVWIDYNHNGKYDNIEWQQICVNSTANVEQIMNLIIPSNALIGKTGMRIRSRASAGANDSTSACAAFGTGETEDYIINIGQALPCTQPPNAGTTISTLSVVCPGTPVIFNITGNSSGIGQSYQWIYSTDGITYKDLLSENNTLLQDTVYVKGYYACVSTCSGMKDTSTISIVNVNPFYNCYCVSNIGGNCNTSATAIDSVALVSTTLSNLSLGCAPNYYTAYPAAANTTATMEKGVLYELQTVFSGVANASLWIDFDHSGTFDTTEWTPVIDTSIAGVVNSRIIAIPLDAKLGKTGMRIRSRAVAGVNGNTNACTTFGSGETEDYVINIDTAAIVQSVATTNVDAFLKLYPNPASTELKVVQLKENFGTLLIYDLQGRLMLNEKLNSYSNSISLLTLNNGLYIYHYINAQNENVSNGKITVLK